MTMKFRLLIGGIVLMACGSTGALAQNSLGELLDAGWKKLSKEQVVATLSGATVTGPTRGGGQREYAYKADGTLSGFLESAKGKGAAVVGTWTVDDNGKLCSELRVRGTVDQVCAFLFAISTDQFYASDSDTDRSSPILKRTIKK
jgi:hypothetical protein